MPGPDGCFFLAAPLDMWAYVGLGPGQEFIPYFLTLLVWAGIACLAVLQWPLQALRRRWARTRRARAEALKTKVEKRPGNEVWP